MNKSWFYLVGTIGTLSILTTSCGDGSKPPATPSASPAAVASPATPTPVAAVPAATTTPTTTMPAVGTKPLVPGKLGVVVASAGLIPPTNGDNWAKTVTKGRTDPFATLVLQPILTKDPLIATGKLQPATPNTSKSPAIKSGVNKSLPTIKTGTNSTNIADVPGKTKIARKGANTNDSGITRDRNSVISKAGIDKVPSKSTAGKKVAKNNVLRPVKMANTPSKPVKVTNIAALPPKAVEKPLQAMAVEISGVIEVEGKTQVIVKLPSESFSRYIEVGDRIANGRVLVKRIEGQNSLSPTVILEEVGVEVSRRVGDKPAPETPGTATPPIRS
ncbi:MULTISPECIES: hypothetical protein [unclassified Chamaesiphon]|uniref:hypothetical protein n=1 Tax=unclassified Chamaesiphon TaxID=2620921 RepID=UPI00286BFB6E|nr:MULTISPECIES: hypothetical protein [unclassified Chamaesiphon]